ncbi:efflux RND transporter periplasmic adaptor subunit [Roseibium sp.]|uniref:efflux RND transporter periplasmic adaptor subunit n=1 Tax=Roseibium sp. TaxID=1936156 RepID=UPI0032982512
MIAFESKPANSMSSAAMVVFLAALFSVASPAFSAEQEHPEREASVHEEDNADKHNSEAEHEKENIVELSDAQLEAANLTLSTAGSDLITPSVELFGVIRPNMERLVHVVPRFEGVVVEAKARLGESVEKGDELVVIESNESLRAYTIKSPIDGQIIRWNVVTGSYAGLEEPLMVIADLSSVWLDLQVHRHDADKIELGQTVSFHPSEGADRRVSTISYMSPVARQDTQSLLARVVVPNERSDLQPGLYMRASVEREPTSAEIVVRRSAIQFEGTDPMLFVQRDEGHFVMRRVQLGRQDSTNVEIINGLSAGEVYVSENSFLLKAEAEKGSATHGH